MRRRAQFRANIFNNCAACQFKLEDYAGAVMKISSAALEINPKYCAVNASPRILGLCVILGWFPPIAVLTLGEL